MAPARRAAELFSHDCSGLTYAVSGSRRLQPTTTRMPAVVPAVVPVYLIGRVSVDSRTLVRRSHRPRSAGTEPSSPRSGQWQSRRSEPVRGFRRLPTPRIGEPRALTREDRCSQDCAARRRCAQTPRRRSACRRRPNGNCDRTAGIELDFLARPPQTGPRKTSNCQPL